MSHLCEVCNGIDFVAISFQPIWAYADMSEGITSSFDQYYITPQHYGSAEAFETSLTPYHRSLGSLVESAKATDTLPEGCQLCNIVLPSVQRVLHSRVRARDQGWDGLDLEVNWSFFVTARRLRGTGILVLGLDDAEGMRRAVRYSIMAVLEFRVDHGTVLSHVFRTFNIVRSPCDPILMERVRHWTYHCRNHHKHSTELEREEIGTHNLPTRLLYISEESKIILINTVYAEQSGRTGEDGYIALSHCWGSIPTLRLETANRGWMRTTGITVQDLPKTFQDAVWVTRSLGYRKLWIDSLCILQDDRDDWKMESAKMHSIYRNAAVVIAASCAVDSTAGFLGPRVRPEYVILPYEGNAVDDVKDHVGSSQPKAHTGDAPRTDATQGYVLVSACPMKWEYHRKGIFRLHEEPLSRRGWALQERMLSSRTIHFTSEGLYLECRHEFVPEKNIPLAQYVIGPVDKPSIAQTDTQSHMETHSPPLPRIYHYRSESASIRAVPRGFSAQGGLPDAKPFSLRSFKRSWHDLVREYSRRLLTFPDDKLPAIAGMAAYFADILNNNSDLYHGTYDHNQVASETGHGPSKLPRYYAGLFISCPGPAHELLWGVDFRHHRRLEMNETESSTNETSPRKPKEYRAPSWSWASLDGVIEWPPRGSDVVDLAVIKSVDVVPLTAENVFGEIASACLRLKAIICSLYLEYSDEGYPSWYLYAPGMSNNKMTVLARWDVGRNFNSPMHRLNQLPEPVSHVEKGKTELFIAVLNGLGKNGVFSSLKGVIIKPLNCREDQREGFERLGIAFVVSADDCTTSMEYVHRLKKMFDSGEEGAEAILF